MFDSSTRPSIRRLSHVQPLDRTRIPYKTQTNVHSGANASSETNVRLEVAVNSETDMNFRVTAGRRELRNGANSRMTESECEPRSGRTLQSGREPRGYRELGSASERTSERQRGDACNMASPLFDSWWAQQGSNLQPKDYESSAPPLSYRPECSRLHGDSALYRKARTSMLSPPDNPSAWRNGSDAAASRAFCSRSDECARA